MTATCNTLAAYLAEIAASEAALEAEGYTVFPLVKEVAFWNERGIFTRDDLGDYLDAECEREERKAAMWADEDPHTTAADLNYYMRQEYDAMMDAMHAEWEAEEAAHEAAHGWERIQPEHIVWNHYQPGWA